MLCEKCGRPISQHSIYCHHCGAKQEYLMTPASYVEPEPVAQPDNNLFSDVVSVVLQADAYKTARRKLGLRIVSIVLLLIVALVGAIRDQGFELFLLLYLPGSFWCSLLFTYLLGDGILGLFKKIGTAIAGIIAWIGACILYGAVILFILAVAAIVIALLAGGIPPVVWTVLMCLGWYSGIVLTVVFGIRNYIDTNRYKDAYQQSLLIA